MQIKHIAAVLCTVCSASASGAERLSVAATPEPVRPLAEAETNVVFSTGMEGENLWKLTIELDASVGNCVEAVFGVDANDDGVLAIEEGEMCVGWDCGGWFWRDRRANTTCRVVGTTQRLDMVLYLARDREAKSLASSVFPSVVSPTCFNPDWNLARVVSRGAEPVRVDSKVSIDALKLRIR